jgi:hypothetical protein
MNYKFCIIIFSFILIFTNTIYAYQDTWIDGTPLLYEEAQSIARALGTGNQNLLAPALEINKPAVFNVGDMKDFFALNMQKMTQYTLKATLRAVSDKAYIFVEDGRLVNDNKINSLLESFDKIYDAIIEKFGPIPEGVDGDPRIYLLIMDIVDGAKANGARMVGYFSPINEYKNNQLGRLTRQRSNEVEMLYIDSISLDLLKDGGEGVVAHEFTHLVQWSRDPLEDVWVNEGIAMYAETMLGYDVKSYISTFEKNPDVSLLNWSGSIENYGAAYLFFAYLSERFGGDSVIEAIVNNTDQGTVAIEKVLAELGKAESFDQLFSEWVVANYLDNPDIYDGIYGYSKLDIHLKPSGTEIQYPIVLKKSSVMPWSVQYIEFDKEKDNILNLTVFKLIGNDIFAQLILMNDKTDVLQVKSGKDNSGIATIPGEVDKGILVVTSQPNPPNSLRIASTYNYSAEIQTPASETAAASVAASGKKTITWGSIKKE